MSCFDIETLTCLKALVERVLGAELTEQAQVRDGVFSQTRRILFQKKNTKITTARLIHTASPQSGPPTVEIQAWLNCVAAGRSPSRMIMRDHNDLLNSSDLFPPERHKPPDRDYLLGRRAGTIGIVPNGADVPRSGARRAHAPPASR